MGTQTGSEVSQESKDKVHDALFGGDSGDEDQNDGSQGGTDDDDDQDDTGSGDGDSGDGDQGDDDKQDVSKLPKWAQDKLKKIEADNFRYRDAARKARTSGGGKDGKAGDDKGDSGKGDKGDGDVDKLVEEAKAQARLDAKAEYSEQLVATRLEAALDALNVPGASDIVSDLNLGKYVTDEGEIDKDKLTAKIEQFKATYRKRRGVGHGNSGGDKNSGTTNADRFADAIGL